MSKKKNKLPKRQYIVAIWRAAILSYQTAPSAVIFKAIGAILNATLPIALTYFAALTTTELAAAFTGTEGAGNRAITYVIITAVLGLVNTIWGSIDSYIQGIMRYKVDAKISDLMYERFLGLHFWRYDDKDTVDTYDKAQRFARFYSYVFDRITDIFSQLVSVVAAVVALFLVIPFIGVLVVIALIPGIYFQFRLSRAQIEHWNENVNARRAQYYIEGSLLQPHAIVELRLNNLVKYLLQLRNKYRDQDERARLEFEKKYIGKQIVSNVFESGVEVGALVWVTLQIIAREQPIGQFIYVQQIVSRAISSANSIVTTISGIDEDLAQLFDYQKFMDYPLHQGEGQRMREAPKQISFEHVSFKYFGSKEYVLHDVSFDIERHQHIAIVGENGAGKSTLIKLLLGLYEPSRGTITADGVDLKEYAIDSWHQQLSVLQQEFQKYHFTDIKNNVYFGDVSEPFSQHRYENAMKKSESHDFVDKLPGRERTYPSTWMEDDEGEKGTSLSGGQWQRLALARSFYRDTPIIILDEPTSAIDALAESRIFKHLLHDETRTIITISHRLTTVEKADIIFVLKDGRVAEQGTHRELVALDGEYVKIFRAQLERS